MKAWHVSGRVLALLLICASVAVFGEAGAFTRGADPAINRPYAHPDFETWLQRFERPGREVYDRRHEIVAALHLRPGMAVADVGAGTGLFTLLFAPVVGPSGRVYAEDVSAPFIRHVLRRARERHLGNVEGVVGTQHGADLPAGSVDLVFVSDTYHHFEAPQEMLASIRRALRANGELVVIDFRREAGVSSDWVMQHVRADRRQVIDEIHQAGFRLVEDSDLLQHNYFLRFRKLPQDGEEG